MQFHVNIPWWSFALATIALIWALTHHGVQLSARITALLGGLEMLIMLALAITFLIHPGPGSSVPCAAQALFIAASLRRHLGRDGFLHPRAERLRGSRAARPGSSPSRQVYRPGDHALARKHRYLLHLHFLCQRNRLGHRRHGGLRLQSQSVLRSWPGAMGRGLVVRCARHHQQRRSASASPAPTPRRA